jgi:hypothetical protein
MAIRTLLACSLALFVAVIPVCGFAEAETAEGAPTLRWDAPVTCPSSDLIDRVAGLVGLAPEGLGEKLLRVDALVRRTASGGWQAQLTIETAAGSGERVFAAEDCRSLIDGTALILALAVDPSAHSSAKTPSLTTRMAPGSGAHVKAASPRPKFLLRPLLAADMGILPDVDLVYGFAAGLAWPRIRFEVDGAYQSAQTVADALGHSGRIRMLVNAGARACVMPWPGGRIEPAGCLGTAFAWMRSTGQENISLVETHDTLAVALTAGAALGVRLRDWLWLRAEGSVGAMVLRPTFHVVGTGDVASDVYSVRRLTGRVGGGLEFRL